MLVMKEDGVLCDVKWEYNKRADHGGVVDTKCFVSVVDESKEGKDRYTVMSEGLAIQSPKDVHCKDTARKVSMTNALADFSKEDKSRFWFAYMNRKVVG